MLSLAAYLEILWWSADKTMKKKDSLAKAQAYIAYLESLLYSIDGALHDKIDELICRSLDSEARSQYHDALDKRAKKRRDGK